MPCKAGANWRCNRAIRKAALAVCRPSRRENLTYISAGRAAAAAVDFGFSAPFESSAMSRIVCFGNWFALVGTALAWFAPPAARGVDRNALAIAAASITKEELKGYVDVLADDTFEGRETGSRGGRAAANYVYKVLERNGASPAGEGGTYFQTFNAASRNVLGIVEGSDPQL